MQWQAMLEWSAGTASRTFGQGEAARARQARAQRTHHARSPSWVRALLADNCVAIATSRRGGLITGRFPGTTQELALRQSSLSVRSLRVGEAGRASTQSYFIFRAQGITRTIISFWRGLGNAARNAIANPNAASALVHLRAYTSWLHTLSLAPSLTQLLTPKLN